MENMCNDLYHAYCLPQVRGKAAFALGQFSEYLQPEIMAHYQEVLPAIFQLLRDTTPEVQERACYGEGVATTTSQVGQWDAIRHVEILRLFAWFTDLFNRCAAEGCWQSRAFL